MFQCPLRLGQCHPILWPPYMPGGLEAPGSVASEYSRGQRHPGINHPNNRPLKEMADRTKDTVQGMGQSRSRGCPALQ